MSKKENPANIESIILSSLIHSEEFFRTALPHIKPEYFENQSHRNIFNTIYNFHTEYRKVPSKEAVEIDFTNSKSSNETIYQETIALIDKLYSDTAREAVNKASPEWLVKSTEKYCLDRSVYLGIMDSLDIIDGTNKKTKKDAIPKILQDALAVSFDTNIGHDYFEDAEQRLAYYHRKTVKIETPLSMLNHVTKKGFERKTINIVVAPTGVGKTHIKTFFAAHYLKSGYNVLYITLEMAEEKIAKRIDACLMDVAMDDLGNLPPDTFMKKINDLKKKTVGSLFVREYPTGSISANNLRFLLDEFKTKKGIEIDILIIDYLNLLASTRLRSDAESYNRVKSVTEEVRAVAQEKNIMILTSTQTNRAGQGASDFDLTEVGESHGISATADSMFACIVTEDLEKLGQMRIKILKNRYGSKSNPSSFIVGTNREKMTLFDIDTISTLPEDKSPKLLDNSNMLSNTNISAKAKGGLIV